MIAVTFFTGALSRFKMRPLQQTTRRVFGAERVGGMQARPAKRHHLIYLKTLACFPRLLEQLIKG
jgi:hypothetical protein